MDMVIGDANWSPGGPVYIIHCSCGRTFPYQGERVRCPRCQSEANLDTLKREWGEIPAEVMEGGYRDAAKALPVKLRSVVRNYELLGKEAPEWLLRRIKELAST